MLNILTAGDNAPEIINVVIEIPANSEPVKYEVDKTTGALHVDRFMITSMRYPCDYGYVPHTLGEDGDPVDILLLSPLPLISGSVIKARPIGMLQMTDESGRDSKILAVPIEQLTPLYNDIHTPDDLQKITLERISHFFQHYKDLEAKKWVEVEGWVGPEEAKKTLSLSIERYINSQASHT